MRIGRYGLSVIVGLPLEDIHYKGRNYVAAPEDTDYQLRVSGPHGGRFEAVISVDGLDVITGKDASVHARGYIVNGANFFLQGFRLNDSEVAQFRFGARNDSYAAQIGKPSNIGVIAAVLYAEKTKPRPASIPASGLTFGASYGAESLAFDSFGASASSITYAAPSPRSVRGSTPKSSGVLRAAAVSRDTGTVFGEKAESNVSYTTFDRGEEVARFVLEYASEEALIAAGVLPPHGPNPFPADKKKLGVGCTPPAGWKG